MAKSKVEKEVKELSLEKIKRMTELSLSEYKKYPPKELSKITNNKIVRYCYIVLRLCKELDEKEHYGK